MRVGKAGLRDAAKKDFKLMRYSWIRLDGTGIRLGKVRELGGG